MQFGDLRYLYLVWILPAMILVAVYGFRSKTKRLASFADPVLWARLVPGLSRRRQILRILLVLAAVALFLVGLLRPRWGYHWEEVKRKGVDLVVAVDLSRSMLAGDVPPSRLERAKREIADLLDMLQGDRIGLVAFAGVSFLQCPLTLDYGAFRLFLDALGPDLIPVPGTAIARAIETALEAYDLARRTSRALLLITDGEDHEGKVEEAAEKAKQMGVRIYAIGIGSDQPAPVPLEDGGGDFQKDRAGQVVMTRLSEPLLQKIALSTGGAYVRSVSGDLDLRKIYQEEIRGKLETAELASGKKRRWEERFQWFLLAGILLLALESLLTEGNRPAGLRSPAGSSWRRFFRAAVLGWAVFEAALGTTLWPAQANAESVFSKIRKAERLYREKQYDKALQTYLDAQVEKPEDPLLRYNIGNAHYQMRNYADAEKAFLGAASSPDPVLAQKALYNLGNCAYRQGKLDQAVAYYQKALDLDPKDEDARYNLEFVREEIKRRLEEARKRDEAQTSEEPTEQKDQAEKAGKQAGEARPQQEEKSEPGGQEKPKADAPEQEGTDQEQEAAVPQAQPGQEEQVGKEPARGAAEAADRMSPEEAERWLGTLDENQQDLLKKQIQDLVGRMEYRPEKDW